MPGTGFPGTGLPGTGLPGTGLPGVPGGPILVPGLIIPPPVGVGGGGLGGLGGLLGALLGGGLGVGNGIGTGGIVTNNPACRDRALNCANYVSYCFRPQYAQCMSENCRRTCGLCNPFTGPGGGTGTGGGGGFISGSIEFPIDTNGGGVNIPLPG